jgi:hypothetical protein
MNARNHKILKAAGILLIILVAYCDTAQASLFTRVIADHPCDGEVLFGWTRERGVSEFGITDGKWVFRFDATWNEAIDGWDVAAAGHHMSKCDSLDGFTGDRFDFPSFHILAIDPTPDYHDAGNADHSPHKDHFSISVTSSTITGRCCGVLFFGEHVQPPEPPPPNNTPESSTWLLLCIGCLGLLGYRYGLQKLVAWTLPGLLLWLSVIKTRSWPDGSTFLRERLRSAASSRSSQK